MTARDPGSAADGRHAPNRHAFADSTLATPRSTRAHTRRMAPHRFEGVAAGPAEHHSASTTSGRYLAEVGDEFEVVARVAGTTPLRDGDAPDIVRHCFRTVDDGLALCCPLPNTEQLRLGSVIHVKGTVTGKRVQGTNLVTEIAPETLDRIG